VEGIRTVRSCAPPIDGLRDGVGNEEGRNADAGSVQISGQDIEGLSEGSPHAPDMIVTIIRPNLHCVPFSLHFNIGSAHHGSQLVADEFAEFLGLIYGYLEPITFLPRRN